MRPLTEPEIRASLVNTSRGEASRAALPDLETIRWERLDYLGWVDPKQPLAAYVVADLPRGLTGIMLRAAQAEKRPRALCVWCQDVHATDDVTLYAARRAGAKGRKGDSVGTLVCTRFRCSANVRRTPTITEVGSDDPADRAALVERRIRELNERMSAFLRAVLDHAPDQGE